MNLLHSGNPGDSSWGFPVVSSRRSRANGEARPRLEKRLPSWLRGGALAAVSALVLVAAPALALAADGNGPEVFPAYYEGTTRFVMMGPSGNSENPNQAPSACFGLGPDFSQTSRSASVPLFYTLFVPGATQMACADGTRKHDMVLTAVPGDPGYNAAVQAVRCVPGPRFSVAEMPFTSAAEVEAGIAAGKLTCSPTRVLLSPVVSEG